MIQASNVTLRLGKKALFEDVNIKFTEGNCYGLIGANGAGKSTFLKILSGELESTSGDVVITPGQRLSFLKLDHFQYDEFVALDTVIMGNERLYDIMKEKDAIYMKEGRRSYMPKAVKEKFGKPCISMGNIRDPKVAEKILADGDADLIGMCRGLIADP